MNKQERIESAIADGYTIQIATMTKIVEITPRTAQRWAKRGNALLKTDSKGATFMARGKSWDCIDHCRITARK